MKLIKKFFAVMLASVILFNVNSLSFADDSISQDQDLDLTQDLTPQDLLLTSGSPEASSSNSDSDSKSESESESEANEHESNSEIISYDIIIAGGGMGGSGAAIQASRMGMKVLIVESTSLLGGQATAAGVSTMDDMSGIESGVYHEFMNQVREYYSAFKKSIATCYWKNYSKAFEPFVGSRILKEMTRSADILYHSEIISVVNTSHDKSVVVRTPEGDKKFAYKILIDATEYGDILPLAGVTYRSGNSISPKINPEAFIQDITWTAIIRKYPKGVPDHLRPKNPLPGYEKARRNYKNYVTVNGFDFRGRYPVQMPVNLVSHNAYRAVPDTFSVGTYSGAKNDWRKITKTGVNWGNDYPGMYLWKGHYGLTVMYLEDKNLRAQIEKDALIKTLHFIYYVQNELGEDWSVDGNEYGDLPEAAKDFPEEWQRIAKHMPPIPYVRESRRMLGVYTFNSYAIHKNSMSWRNGERNNEFPDAIAIAGYNLDLHGGDDDDDIESSLSEKQASIYAHMPQGAFQVPISVFLTNEVDNFIPAEKNLSMSRLASSALRLQPICMMTGQAAGALAAVAIKSGLQPRDVHALHVQKVLADSGVVLSLCNFSDVPRSNKYFASVQLSQLYRLINARSYPNLPAKHINSSRQRAAKGRINTKGVFGLNDRISKREINSMIMRAEEVMKAPLELPLALFKRNITKGEAVDLIIKAMDNVK
ncbi:MAG: FAD-dependent oxidoreductase [Synergistaceae bacterium]|nr:FAD-dependent oxidoreductase [Synergistaceae bacterium]